MNDRLKIEYKQAQCAYIQAEEIESTYTRQITAHEAAEPPHLTKRGDLSRKWLRWRAEMDALLSISEVYADVTILCWSRLQNAERELNAHKVSRPTQIANAKPQTDPSPEWLPWILVAILALAGIIAAVVTA